MKNVLLAPLLEDAARWRRQLEDAGHSSPQAARAVEDAVFAALCRDRGVAAPATGVAVPAGLPLELLGALHESTLDRDHRRRRGVFYTPPALAADLVARVVSPGTDVLDPTCGGGAFLLAAFRRGVPLERLHGVDRDADAVRVTRRTLALAQLEQTGQLVEPPHVAVGDGLALPARGGFAAVIGNPPWGQKAITADKATRAEVIARFPSARGIFDWFRPFVERSVRALAPGGRLGLVLPDILLLKDYEPTRALLLDETSLDAIEWHGMAFPGAVIDAITLVATRRAAPAGHRVSVAIHDPADPLRHELAQSDFAANPRRTFNLRLTAPRRRVLDALARHPRLGDFYEVHEGVHSGNQRAELFVGERLDDSCRPLYVGRGELAQGRLRWAGRWLRLGAVPDRGGAAYANVGRREWHERPKVLVRRTGDRVQAAVDGDGYYASNNFFLVLPRQGAPLSLTELWAYLNSPLATWFFRAIEPRRGRVFAELKIKHLSHFPLPPTAGEPMAAFGLDALPD